MSVKERPILFSGPMIRAILDGRKTMTRRVVKDQPCAGALLSRDAMAPSGYAFVHDLYDDQLLKCPYGRPGDRLVPAVEIPGYDGKYAAGVNGKIYSKARGDWRQLKEWHNPKGYQLVTLVDRGRKVARNVHRLVCVAFYGPAPTPSHQVRHLDGNPPNGAPSNLAWGTQEENWQDRKVHGNGVEGEKHHSAKFTNEEREHIKWAIGRGLCSQKAAARTLGVTQSSIHHLLGSTSTEPVEQDIPEDRFENITLEITDVRVERLQDITEEDAVAEGIVETDWGYETPRGTMSVDGDKTYHPFKRRKIPARFHSGEATSPDQCLLRAKWAFSNLWQSINGPDSWDANPWCWVVSFQRHD